MASRKIALACSNTEALELEVVPVQGTHKPHIVQGQVQPAQPVENAEVHPRPAAGASSARGEVHPGGFGLIQQLAPGRIVPDGRDQRYADPEAGQVLGHISGHPSRREADQTGCGGTRMEGVRGRPIRSITELPMTTTSPVPPVPAPRLERRTFPSVRGWGSIRRPFGMTAMIVAAASPANSG